MSEKPHLQKRFCLVLNGPSCGGKSSVAEALTKRYGGIFNAKRDGIKWLISDYASGKYVGVLDEMLIATQGIALAHGLSVLQEGWRPEPDRLVDLARKHKVPIYFANVSAPREVLQERFRERVTVKKEGARIANKDPGRFEELHQLYESTKVQTPLEFDSSQQSPDEMVDEIVAHILG